MIKLFEYINLPKTERQKHIDRKVPCLERGGNSTNHKGVLAQYLGSEISCKNVLLCHACGNGNCSEPRHLYWGTYFENTVEDGKEFGTWKDPYQRAVEKRGKEELKELKSKISLNNTNGSGNKGKSKSEEHKKKIAEAANKRYEEKRALGLEKLTNGGRPKKNSTLHISDPVVK